MKTFFKKIVVAVLIFEARLVLKKYKPKIIAVSGSVGKTSTKDAIFTVLSGSTYVRKSQKSFNSEIGIPLTILGAANAWSDPFLWLRTLFEGLLLFVLPNHYPKLLILEVGADRPGDISEVVKWVKPDTSVITKLSRVPVHVEFFASPEQVIEEKSNLAKALKANGTLILNADDSDVMSFSKLTTAKSISYGFSESAQIQASDYKIVYGDHSGVNFPTGISYKVTLNFNNSGVANETADKTTPETTEIFINETIGMQNVYTNLAAIAVGLSQGLALAAIAESLKNHEAPPGRMRILDGINQTLVIDDSYNSSPIAQKGALETLADIAIDARTSGKKIAVLGDMLELGAFSVAEHKIVGVKAASVCSDIITVGPRARTIREAAVGAGMSEGSAVSFDDSALAGEYVAKLLRPGDVVLVKGSQGNIRMERAVAEIMKEKGRKGDLLVRQETEWQNR